MLKFQKRATFEVNSLNYHNMNVKKVSAAPEKMDSLDKRILSIISQNARIPFRDVALQCGVSRAAIHQRVQRLFDDGVITGT